MERDAATKETLSPEEATAEGGHAVPVDQAARLAERIARDHAARPHAESRDAYVRRLDRSYGDLPAEEFLRVMITREFPGRIALVSSFGAEAAVLLDLVARVDKSLPVIFLDTGLHFAQTLQYRRQLTERLGLRDVRSIEPDQRELAREDPENSLWQWDTDKCCHIRKVVPLDKALAGFDVWVNGRKQMHGGARVRLPRIELNGKHIKVNPLARWTREDVEAAFRDRDLPHHPLRQQGYASIGCWPCTQPTRGDDLRSGRWADSEKTECGIHGPLTLAGS